MIRIISSENREKWNDIVKSFNHWDVYYLNEYATSFKIHGDGEPFLIFFENDLDRFCYVVMKRDIADDNKFEGKLEKNKYFDYETPYGYGGPLCDGTVSRKSQFYFAKELRECCNTEGVVEQFVRFHPILENHRLMPEVFELKYIHDTIYIDTESKELLMTNMDGTCRNMIRKAEKNGVSIVRKPITQYQDFIAIYEETMNRDNAEEYYYFNKEYFDSLSMLKDNASIFYAIKDEQMIAASIVYYNERFMHYHLAGTRTDYRRFAPTNLLLYKVAYWGNEKGVQKFHLGGGINQDDSLFGFKKKFNKNGRLQFWVGRTIFNEKAYEDLLNIRVKLDPSFDKYNTRMTQYRA